MLVIGIICGIYFATKQVKKEQIDEDTISNLVFIMIISGLIGARMFYVLFYNLIYFFNNPLDIFIFYEGGLSTYGGIIGSIIGVSIYSKRSKIPFFEFADFTLLHSRIN